MLPPLTEQGNGGADPTLQGSRSRAALRVGLGRMVALAFLGEVVGAEVDGDHIP